ncbi:hypothetical protein N1851_022778 [Merluccius polli]|uniref:CCHC-type domain-containing protein n=1 Tax=Merluccius polli TaxID=89951 RepID=A0AA47MH93_MERPO|nr:hypothetical protein N1851_022778 [Merluccius polli]
MFAAKQSESEFQYDSKLVQGVFLHSLYQGLNEKYSYLRRDLKPHIANLSTSEEFILDLMTRVVSEEMERQIRLGQTQKNRTLTVNATQQGGKQKAAQSPAETPASVLQTQAEVLANRTAIHELTAQVSALAKSLEKALTPVLSNVETVNTPQTTSAQPSSVPRGKCKTCIAEGIVMGTHCFKCGNEGHRAVGCLATPSENWKRSLGRDHQ